MDGLYPQKRWSDVLSQMQHGWSQGEHVAIVGATGCGKTTLVSRLAPIRRYVVVFVTKVHDDTIKHDFKGFERIESWPPRLHQNRVLLWPEHEKTIRATYDKQREVFQKAMDSIFIDRNWCVVFDEQHYMCHDLQLTPENTMFQHQGRSSGLSIVNGTQRPAWVPLITYSGSTHAFIWKTDFAPDLKRLSELGGVDKRQLQTNIQTLNKHQFVYVNTRNGETIRSEVER